MSRRNGVREGFKRGLVLVVALLTAVAVTGVRTEASAAVTRAARPGIAANDPGPSADITFGPWTIPPTTDASSTTGFSLAELLNFKFSFNKAAPCGDCYITSVVPEITDTSGNVLSFDDSGIMLHHIVIYQNGMQDVACPGLFTPGYFGRRIFASGNERTQIPYTPGYGLYVPSGGTYNAMADLMNMGTASKTVQVRLHVTYATGARLKAVTPVWLDVTGCNPLLPSYSSVPAGPATLQGDWTSSLTGDLIGLGGHVHPYGSDIVATDTTSNTQLCDSKATQMDQGGMPMITDMSICRGTGSDYVLAHINKGDHIHVVAHYDTPTSEFLAVMGIMIAYIYPTS